MLTVELASVTPAAVAGGEYSTNPALSADGRFVAFQSHAADLVSSDSNGTQDVFVRDLMTGTTALISIDFTNSDSASCSGSFCGGSVSSGSFNPVISDDGRFVAFVSHATDLTEDDIDIVPNVFVRDRDTDEDGIFDEPDASRMTLLSRAIDGTAAGVPATAATRPVIAGDGSFVAFNSFAADMALNDVSLTDFNGSGGDVFLADVAGGPVSLVTVNGDDTGTDPSSSGSVFDLSISGTGGLVAFATTHDELISAATGTVDDTNGGTFDVFVGSGNDPVVPVSINATDSGTGDGASREPVVSRDGRHVAFISKATNLVAGTDLNDGEDIFVRDLVSDRTTLISHSRTAATPTTGDAPSPPPFVLDDDYLSGPGISDDGRFVVFRSLASDLLDPTGPITDANAAADIFVYDRDPDRNGKFDEVGRTETILVTVNSSGTASATAGIAANPTISADGRYVAFSSDASDIVPGVSGLNVYIRDIVGGVTTLVSDISGAGSGGPSDTTPSTRSVTIARDGSVVGFQSATDASLLDPGVVETPSTLPVSFAEIDVFVGTTPTDIMNGPIAKMAIDEISMGYRIGPTPVESPFGFGFYRSADRTFSIDDIPLDSLPITSPDDMSVGSHGLIPRIGDEEGEIALPGIGAAVESDEDYFILIVADDAEEIDEMDSDPFAEDNTGLLGGAYFTGTGPVYYHGRDAAEAGLLGKENIDILTVFETDDEFLLFNDGPIGGEFALPAGEVTGLRARLHSGDDSAFGSSLADYIHGGEGDDTIDGGDGDDVLDGGPGDDTLIGGPGVDTYFDGCGDDVIIDDEEDSIVFSTPCSDDIFIDSGGADVINFSLDDLPITLDLDSDAVQTVDADSNTIWLQGVWESVVGTDYDDSFTVRPLIDPRTLSGGLGNDSLLVDAGGHVVVDDGTRLSFPNSGLGDISYADFETIRVINAAPRILDDGDNGYTANGFGRQSTGQGFNGDIEFSEANSGNTATWTFSDIPAGTYQVAATWTPAADRATSAPFRFFDGGSSSPPVGQTTVNQELPPNEFTDQGTTWRNLGIVEVTGNMLTVELSDLEADTNADDEFEFVVADAVRIEPISATLIIDNGDPEFSSIGESVEGLGAFGDVDVTERADGIFAVWDCTSDVCAARLPNGYHQVSATWPVKESFQFAGYEIVRGEISFLAFVDHGAMPNGFSEAGITWAPLTAVPIDPAVGARVDLTSISDDASADAIRFDPSPRAEVLDLSGNPVADGGQIDLGVATIDPDTGQATIEATLTVVNTGLAPLILGELWSARDVFSIDGLAGGTLAPGGSTTFSIRATTSSLGEIADTLGIFTNVATDTLTTFDVVANVFPDDTPPVVSFAMPVDGASVVEGSQTLFEIDVDDDAQLRSVELLIDGQVVATEEFGFDARDPSSEEPIRVAFEVAVPTIVIDPFALVTAQAVDVAGNQSSAEIGLNLLPDRAPQVAITGPLDETGVQAGTPFTVFAEAADDVAVTAVTFSVIRNGIATAEQLASPYFQTLIAPEAAGDFEVEVCAIDNIGQQSCTSITLTAFTGPAYQPGTIIAAPASGGAPLVRLFNSDGTRRSQFFAYSPVFTGGVRVATGDITGDGIPDIITAPGPGGGPHVKVFDGQTGSETRSFFAYGTGFTGGIFVAAGDVNGDGRDDIITGAGAGGGPHVRVFSGLDGTVLRDFLAFSNNFTGGVFVAAGDVDGDAQADIVVGAGAGGGPHVRVFDGFTGRQTFSVVPYDPGFTGGVRVAVADVNGDSFDDIITSPGAGGGPHVKVFDANSGGELLSFFAYTPSFAGGVFVGAADLNEDGAADIVTSPGSSDGESGPTVRVFNGRDATDLGSFSAFDSSFRGGVFVAANSPSSATILPLPPEVGPVDVMADNDDVVVLDHDGFEHFRRNQNQLHRLRINGTDVSDDTLNIHVDGLRVPVVFSGGVAANDRMTLNGTTQFARIVHNFSSNTGGEILAEDIAFERKMFLYRGLEPIEDDLSALDRVFTVDTATNVEIRLMDDGDLNNNRTLIDANGTGGFESVAFVNPSNSLKIEDRTGGDSRILVTTPDAAFSAAVSVAGGDGFDSLELSGELGELDLRSTSASGASGIEEIHADDDSPQAFLLDVAAVADNGVTPLVMRLDDRDEIELGVGWTLQAPRFVDGQFFNVLTSDDATLHLHGPNFWQNPLTREDVDGDGNVFPLDVLKLINAINALGSSPLGIPTPENAPPSYLDPSGDGNIFPLDVAIVINFINSRIGLDGLGEGERQLELAPAPLFTGSIEIAAISSARPSSAGHGDFQTHDRVAAGNANTNNRFSLSDDFRNNSDNDTRSRSIERVVPGSMAIDAAMDPEVDWWTRDMAANAIPSVAESLVSRK